MQFVSCLQALHLLELNIGGSQNDPHLGVKSRATHLNCIISKLNVVESL